jgi:hypothetical protein
MEMLALMNLTGGKDYLSTGKYRIAAWFLSLIEVKMRSKYGNRQNNL